jgi:LIM domain kinase 1
MPSFGVGVGKGIRSSSNNSSNTSDSTDDSDDEMMEAVMGLSSVGVGNSAWSDETNGTTIPKHIV